MTVVRCTLMFKIATLLFNELVVSMFVVNMFAVDLSTNGFIYKHVVTDHDLVAMRTFS